MGIGRHVGAFVAVGAGSVIKPLGVTGAPSGKPNKRFHLTRLGFCTTLWIRRAGEAPDVRHSIGGAVATQVCPVCGRKNPAGMDACQWCKSTQLGSPGLPSQVGQYSDGRPLNRAADGSFDIAGYPVSRDYVLGYEAAGQIRWASPDARRFALRTFDDSPLTSNQYILFTLLFVFLPGACVLVSSLLYYLWRSERPRQAAQINQLGFIVFAANIVLYFGLKAFGIV